MVFDCWHSCRGSPVRRCAATVSQAVRSAYSPGENLRGYGGCTPHRQRHCSNSTPTARLHPGRSRLRRPRSRRRERSLCGLSALPDLGSTTCGRIGGARCAKQGPPFSVGGGGGGGGEAL